MPRVDDGTEPGERLLDAIYRGVGDTAQFERALELIGTALGCRATTLLSIGAKAPAANLALSTGAFDEAVRAEYARGFAELDPAPAVFTRMRVGTASTTDRLMGAEAVAADPFFNEFFRPLGFIETIGGLLSGNGRFEMIGLLRGSDRDAFTDTELRYVERLLPHVARSLQLRRVFLTADARLSSVETLIDRLPAGIVILDGDGQGVFVNRAMAGIARRGDGLWLDRQGRIVSADLAVRKRLDTIIADVLLRGGAGGLVAVPSAASAQAYAVLVAPALPSVRDELLPGLPGGAIVVVHDPAAQPRPPVALIQEALNLPRGAAEVAMALAAGHDLQSFAATQGVTIHTARFHLRTALARTGATTQAGLTRITVALLRDVLTEV
jgi:PAS domain-containing protein